MYCCNLQQSKQMQFTSFSPVLSVNDLWNRTKSQSMALQSVHTDRVPFTCQLLFTCLQMSWMHVLCKFLYTQNTQYRFCWHVVLFEECVGKAAEIVW